MGLHILVVDDDLINRKLIQAILKRNSKVETIIEAVNGQDAMNKMDENAHIDLVLLDIFMPVVDGIDFLRIIRSNRNFSHIPVIILSTDDTRKSEALDLGANSFLRKPIREEEISETINAWS
jgi:putative two-component system response regulator